MCSWKYKFLVVWVYLPIDTFHCYIHVWVFTHTYMYLHLYFLHGFCGYCELNYIMCIILWNSVHSVWCGDWLWCVKHIYLFEMVMLQQNDIDVISHRQFLLTIYFMIGEVLCETVSLIPFCGMELQIVHLTNFLL